MIRPQVDIIMLALARWDGPYSSTAFSMAKELSRHSRVFYIDNPFTYKDIIKGLGTNQVKSRYRFYGGRRAKFQSIMDENKNLVNVIPKPMYPINFLPKGRIHDRAIRINDERLLPTIDSIKQEFQVKDYILFNCFNPFYLFNPSRLDARCTVYYCVDNISKSKYIYKHGVDLEKRVIRNYDVTLTTSKELFNYAKTNTEKAYFLPNAVDFGLFQRALSKDVERPIDISQVPLNKKIIGYIGHIDHRVDYKLLRQVAERHHDKIILLIGPVSSDQFESVCKLPNVLAIGKKTLEELPLYLKFIDCCIIPFVKNELTSCIYPLKLNEYLAAGKPVVSTRFSPDLAEFDSIISAADTNEQFCDLIEDAILGDSEDQQIQRIRKAEGNTWSVRVDQFWQILNPIIGRDE